MRQQTCIALRVDSTWHDTLLTSRARAGRASHVRDQRHCSNALRTTSEKHERTTTSCQTDKENLVLVT